VTNGPDGRPPLDPNQPRPTFLPPEDSPDQPVWDPEFPPEPRTRSALILPLVIVAALVLAGGGSWLIARGDESSGAPTPSATVAGVRFRRLPPPCFTVSAPTVRRLVADAATLTGPGATQADRVTARCGWDDSYDPRKRHGFRDQSLKVDMAAYLSGPFTAGTDTAKISLESRRDVARETANKVDNNGLVFTYGPLTELTGLGDEAFSTFYTVGLPTPGEHLPSTATITMRISNAVVEVTYSASNLVDKTPLNDSTARQAAETAARDVASALTSCTTCAN
jgi:hypothetical protein